MIEEKQLNYATSTGKELHISTLLDTPGIGYRPNESVAGAILPAVGVPKEYGNYAIYSRGEWLRTETALRARGTEANRINRSVSSAQYLCTNYALKMPIYLEDERNADDAYAQELFQSAGTFLQAKHALAWEKRVLDLFGVAANVSTTFVPSSAWNATGTTAGDPISQITQLCEQFQNYTTLKPTRLVFGWKAWSWFRKNANVRNCILGANNGGGFASRAAAAAVFEVSTLIVSNLFVNSANEAQADALATAFADKVAAIYVPDAPSRSLPSWGYSFRWKGEGLAQMEIELHPFDVAKKMREIEVGYYQAEVVTAPEYAAVLSGVGSAQGSGLT